MHNFKHSQVAYKLLQRKNIAESNSIEMSVKHFNSDCNFRVED